MGMGRPNTLMRDTPVKLHLTRVRLDSQGYEVGSPQVYWGTGDPLWCAYNPATGNFYYLRAPSREDAKKHFPNAKFFR